MTGPAITIGADAMRDVVAAAIMQHISTDERNLLVQNAIAYLMSPQKSGQGMYAKVEPSPLAEAFNNAARQVAFAEARTALADNPEFTAKMAALIAEATERVFTTRREQTVERIANAITRAFDRDD